MLGLQHRRGEMIIEKQMNKGEPRRGEMINKLRNCQIKSRNINFKFSK